MVAITLVRRKVAREKRAGLDFPSCSRDEASSLVLETAA